MKIEEITSKFCEEVTSSIKEILESEHPYSVTDAQSDAIHKIRCDLNEILLVLANMQGPLDQAVTFEYLYKNVTEDNELLDSLYRQMV